MKNKFQRMTKEEQKLAIERFKKEKNVSYLNFKKTTNVCKFGIAYALISLIVDFYLKYNTDYGSITTNLIIDCILLIFCVSFLIFSKGAMEKQVNTFLVKELHDKQKKQWEEEKKKIDEEVVEVKTTKKKKTSNTKVKKDKVKKSGKTTKSNS